jgi:hypothetical protein
VCKGFGAHSCDRLGSMMRSRGIMGVIPISTFFVVLIASRILETLELPRTFSHDRSLFYKIEIRTHANTIGCIAIGTTGMVANVIRSLIYPRGNPP